MSSTGVIEPKRSNWDGAEHMTPKPTNQPAFTRAETLKNGLVVTIRDLRPDDRDRVARAVRQLDPQSVYTRLFSHRKELTEAGLNRIMSVDPATEIALVVTTGAGTGEAVIGSGRAIASESGAEGRTAEVAFVVEEDFQGLGMAGRLLAHLAAIARERGFTALEADVLAENKAMLAVFAKSGLPMRKRQEGGIVHLTLALAPSS
jgi:GNAT superfamily N-acetyltransferase